MPFTKRRTGLNAYAFCRNYQGRIAFLLGNVHSAVSFFFFFHLAELCTPMPYEGTSVFGRITEPLAVLQLDHSFTKFKWECRKCSANMHTMDLCWKLLHFYHVSELPNLQLTSKSTFVEGCSIDIMFRGSRNPQQRATLVGGYLRLSVLDVVRQKQPPSKPHPKATAQEIRT